MDAWSFLDGLTADQVSWMLRNCTEREVDRGDTIIEIGATPPSIFIVLTGLYGFYPTADRSNPINVTGAGELLGETSFLNDQPAIESVVALETGSVLELPVELLKDKLKTDYDFAARAYHAIALIILWRLHRLTDHHVASQEQSEVWDKLAPIVEQLKVVFGRADRQAAKGNMERMNELSRQLRDCLTGLMWKSNEILGDNSGYSFELREQVGLQLQREMRPFITLSENADRWFSKPRGYAGDYYTIELIYRDVPKGKGRVGLVFDSFFLDMPPVRAVRNRRGVLSREIMATVAQAREKRQTARVCSFACGPAREIFDVFEKLEHQDDLLATLIDLDEKAINFVRKARNENNLHEHIRLANQNLMYLARGETDYELPTQDLIYSVGLIDYFPNQFVASLINFAYDSLAPGGRLILGNFHPKNPGKAIMDYILDWRLLHRNEDELHELMKQSKFGKPCSRIFYEKQGINLFAECVRDD
jgi:CRP-like cAMP-binding protein/SAM-dependent methyltransferase